MADASVATIIAYVAVAAARLPLVLGCTNVLYTSVIEFAAE